MSDFKAKMHKIRFPLGKLTAFTIAPSIFLKGGRGKKKGNGEGKGR